MAVGRSVREHDATKVLIQGRLVTHVDEVFGGTSVEDCIRRAQQKYPGLEIDGVDEEVFLGLCEDCGKALFPQDEYVCDDDGIKWCKRHDSVLED